MVMKKMMVKMNNESQQTINLFSLKNEIMKFVALAIIFWFIFKEVWLAILIALGATFFFMMIYNAKVLIDNDTFCVWFYLRPFGPKKNVQIQSMKKIVFANQKTAGASDLIEVSMKDGSVLKYHVYYSTYNITQIKEKLSRRVEIIEK